MSKKGEISDKIKSINNVRLGSFGEFLFECCFETDKSQTIEKKHTNYTDYIVNGHSVDVKTLRRWIDSENREVGHYRGQKRPEIKYALVEFFARGVNISIEGNLIRYFDWSIVEAHFEKWENGHKHPVSTSECRKTNTILFNKIKADLVSFFQLNCLECRIIYRTSQHRFGNESPDNLKPTNLLSNRINVFISFEDSVSVDTIMEIFAFSDFDSNNLPMMPPEKVYLHKPKVDLRLVDMKYRFTSIGDLKEHFDRLL